MSGKPYDPRDAGALCDVCPVGPNGPYEVHKRAPGESWLPVPTEHHETSVLALAQAPGREEELAGRPLVPSTLRRTWSGETTWNSGAEWEHWLRTLGYYREHVALGNVIECRPYLDDYRGLLTRVRKLNARIEAEAKAGGWKPDTWKLPTECCKPRLDVDLERYPHLIALGGEAMTTVTGTDQGIFALRGDIRETVGHKIVPMFNPGFVVRKLRWRQVCVEDLAKAFRFFTGTLRDTNFWVDYRPTPATLRAFYREYSPLCWYFAFDLEADAREPLLARLRCIQVATPPIQAPCHLCHGRGCPVCHGIGYGTSVRIVVIPVRSVGGMRFDEPGCTGYGWKYQPYRPGEVDELIAIQCEAWTSGPVWVSWNGRYWDRMKCESELGVTPHPALDLIMACPLVAPELPKGLGVWGSILTDIHAWKADNEGKKIAWNAQTDDQLHNYGGKDGGVTSLCVQPLMERIEARGLHREIRADLKPAGWPAHLPWTLLGVGHFKQDLCVGLHRNGMYVDQANRIAHERRLGREIGKYRSIVVQLAHDAGVYGPPKRKRDVRSDFNPGSYPQVGRLLYDVWGWTPVVKTDSGEPSTKDEALRAHLIDPSIPPKQKEIIRALRRFRQALKDRGTFVRAAAPMGTPGVSFAEYGLSARDWLALLKEDEYLDEGESPDDLVDEGLCHPDGRIRADWNAHGTPHRLSCSHPNLQNVPGKGRRNYRTIYVPAPGHVFVGFDLDQAHLKIVANYWGVEELRNAFILGIDPHSQYARAFFGVDFETCDGWEKHGGFTLKGKPAKNSSAEKLRNAAKTGKYTFIYWAEAETGWKVFTKTEDPATGELLYANYSLPEVTRLRQVMLDVEPGYLRAWNRELETYDARKRNEGQGYMTSVLFGMRCDFLDGPSRSDIVNFPILATEAEIMRLIEADILAEVPFECWGPGTGIVNQCHDSIVIECPADGAYHASGKWKAPPGSIPARVLELCNRVGNRSIPGWDIPITVEAGIGMSFAEV